MGVTVANGVGRSWPFLITTIWPPFGDEQPVRPIGGPGQAGGGVQLGRAREIGFDESWRRAPWPRRAPGPRPTSATAQSNFRIMRQILALSLNKTAGSRH
jgi:hypothetical protein